MPLDMTLTTSLRAVYLNGEAGKGAPLRAAAHNLLRSSEGTSFHSRHDSVIAPQFFMHTQSTFACPDSNQSTTCSFIRASG